MIDTKQKVIVGVWNTEFSLAKLGELLIFLAELQVQCFRVGATIVDLCLIDPTKSLKLEVGKQSGKDAWYPLQPSDVKASDIISAILTFDLIHNCYLFDGSKSFRLFLEVKSLSVVWPKQGELEDNYRYGTTIYLQRFYAEHKFIPYIRSQKKYLVRAEEILSCHTGISREIIVHLKNNQAERGNSNANLETWFEFFHQCHKLYEDVKFILIGDESPGEKILHLPNIFFARHLGSSLATDLALIQIGRAFMGMSSGPCSVAILNNKPYVIYKNPDHHAKEMLIELSDKDHYSFSAPNQRFLRINETVDNLLTSLQRLLLSPILPL